MALIFLGTSNCVIGASFVDAAREVASETVVNASVGASPSRTGLYMMADVDFKKGDVVVLDYTITDGYYLPNNQLRDGMPYYTITQDSIRQELLSIIDRLYRAGALPVLMVNPSKHGLTGYLDLERVHTEICREHGIPVFNAGNLMRHAVARGAEINTLMRDDTHAAPAVTAVLGRALVDIMAKVREMGQTVALDGRPVFKSRVILASPLVDPERRIAFSSRLRTSEMAWLHTGDTIHFDVQPDEQVLGMVVNMGGPGAKVRLSSSHGGEVRDLIYNWENENPKVYMSIFVSMRTVITGGAEGVTLEVLSQDGPVTPPDLFQPPVMDLVYDNVSIEGLLVATLGDSLTTGSPAPADYDLLDGRYDELADELIRVTSALSVQSTAA